jgi:hypothetical protein
VDIFTKPLGPYQFLKFRDKLGVICSVTIKGGGYKLYLIIVIKLML